MSSTKRAEREKINRREFLRRSTCAGFSMAGMFSAVSSLKLLEAQMAAQCPPGPGDYKAMVCLFLFGGNDANNMIIPMDTAGYTAYAASRAGLAIPQNQILPINDANSDGRLFGLHPSMGPLRDIYGIPNSSQPGNPALVTGPKKCAFVANVGTLLAPITKAEFQNGGSAIPPFLYSHNDQQAQWQSSVPDAQKKVGWAGKIADLKQALNCNTNISMNISVAGNNFLQIGENVFQYQVGNSGSVGLNYWTSNDPRRAPLRPAFNSLFSHDYDNLFEQEYAAITQRAIANDEIVTAALRNIQWFMRTGDNSIDAPTGGSGLPTPDPAKYYFTGHDAGDPLDYSQLQRQLQIILRMIKVGKALGMRRQIFFCAIGGFDTHATQDGVQTVLLNDVARSVRQFYNGTVGEAISEQVTLFTASDFNRTYSPNSDGTDHAWGSHHIVIGGGVNGGSIYGQMPNLVVNGPDDASDRGNWIPTTSVDEYAATLSRWFGVSENELSFVLPNIGRFSHPNLGFMAPV